ncbi:isochorismate synthase [Lentibacillus saliphilus]|uniref:isochorismate synthase n=1 Tax=Lentibacillus saliphilus TaxID=2737028 RepID=UPI001C302607|nr:isochorismate synthase [Lentibacillus saliphilus]
MIDTKKIDLQYLLNKGFDQAKVTKQKHLVSMTEQLSAAVPLYVFRNAGRHALSRAFWMTPDRHSTIVGAGEAHVLVEDSNKSSSVQHEWQSLQQHAIVHNPYDAIEGTGLMVLGGMTFDAQKPSSDLWSEFDTKKFIVPTFVLVNHNDTVYLTTTLAVGEDDNIQQMVADIESMQVALLNDPFPQDDLVEMTDYREIAPEAWKNTVRQATENIKSGYTEKIVLAREVRLKFANDVDHAAVLEQLIETQPSSYIFAFHYGDDCFIGATPEQLVKVNAGQVFSMCLAGTAPRGETDKEDMVLADRLLNDEKNRAEHDFVVQMIRESLEQYCEQVDIPDVPHVHQLKNLQHLYTPVSATIASGHDLFELVEALHPTPALGGVPRDVSLAFIRDYEQLDRGWYGAPVGWLDCYGNGEFAVAIRSGLIQGDEASLFAGCGIVADSDPEIEYEETNIKLKPMLHVLGG